MLLQVSQTSQAVWDVTDELKMETWWGMKVEDRCWCWSITLNSTYAIWTLPVSFPSLTKRNGNGLTRFRFHLSFALERNISWRPCPKVSRSPQLVSTPSIVQLALDYHPYPSSSSHFKQSKHSSRGQHHVSRWYDALCYWLWPRNPRTRSCLRVRAVRNPTSPLLILFTSILNWFVMSFCMSYYLVLFPLSSRLTPSARWPKLAVTS